MRESKVEERGEWESAQAEVSGSHMGGLCVYFHICGLRV